ncbi:GNAT family N-acetyltransferase [Mycobacterium sp. 663a-19]|uniref:GNAT family N-acetyltransferase n=1 Tax=Mycobacterium sp. 663a-19 TaxID=2986148 RepID=UPI002D1E8BC6|nr:GNAT family N-acetyltransferase [Mycobacterium sp. 663a-19]MEB3980497.1 GNAT family N-acetyltransferase [Mycobacterium sp. 663a-19]
MRLRKRRITRPENGEVAEPIVTNASEKNRYEISTEGEAAGLADYVDSRNQRIFYHTEVDKKFTGHGLAGKLIGAALDDTRAAGKRIVAICPFVAAFVDRGDDYADILDPITPQAHAAVRAETS